MKIEVSSIIFIKIAAIICELYLIKYNRSFSIDCSIGIILRILIGHMIIPHFINFIFILSYIRLKCLRFKFDEFNLETHLSLPVCFHSNFPLTCYFMMMIIITNVGDSMEYSMQNIKNKQFLKFFVKITYIAWKQMLKNSILN